jgi:hypothetical protein
MVESVVISESFPLIWPSATFFPREEGTSQNFLIAAMPR